MAKLWIAQQKFINKSLRCRTPPNTTLPNTAKPGIAAQ
jgi:hypothetical protein